MKIIKDINLFQTDYKGKKIWVIVSDEQRFYEPTDLLYEKVIVKRDIGMYVERKFYKVIATANDKIDGIPYVKLPIPTESKYVAFYILETEPINIIHKIYKYFKIEHKTKLKICPCPIHSAGRIFIDRIIFNLPNLLIT